MDTNALKHWTTNMKGYIGDPITVEFDRPPLFSKRPHCPDRFTWNGAVSYTHLTLPTSDLV